MGQTRRNSDFDGIQDQGGFVENDSQWADTAQWKLCPIRDTTAGKILERIESLQERHIKYVRAHKSRLNARLDEASIEEEEFTQEANQIKSDLYHLAMAQQEADGNGHIN
ncbi:MAG: hypothetical protein F6K62_12245 [Sphaerospermopsis sp. SIO1G2]|nr:hypothetical protein [Sphaerospermopsis sp. SIO1G2]